MPLAESPTMLARPELLAPAGDRTCMVAAIENGADAIYFGLHGHNARARATNFALDELPEIMSLLHARGVKGYVTLNTLVFPAELEGMETLVRRIALAGADAVIVQDIGLARMIRAITPDLEIHGSTQMSISSVEGVRLAAELGCTRVILARELSLREIAAIRADSPIPVEVFVHGALCVAYSGQCLTSEALGGRSANRGECAQACRMPYEMVCDSEVVPLGDIQYLLSPQDLAAFDLVPKLVELGIASLKIEGRLKAPEYVAQITRSYRRAIDETLAGHAVEFSAEEIHAMEMTFSRGFSHGFFDGNDHKVLVRGDHAKKRGVFLGEVKSVVGNRVRLNIAAPVKPGDGVVFDGSEANGIGEQGGRVYEVIRSERSRSETKGTRSEGLAAGSVDLGFGHRDIDLRKIRVGQRLWKTDDPELTKQVRATFEGHPHRLVDIHVQVFAKVDQPLRIVAASATGYMAEVADVQPLSIAERLPATSDSIREGLDRLGGTIYRLGSFDAVIEGNPLVPKSLVNRLRREIVSELDASASRAPRRSLAGFSVVSELRSTIARSTVPHPSKALLSTLSRNIAQAETSALCGVDSIYLDFANIKEYKHAIAAVRALSPEIPIFLATPRIEKPGEAPIFSYLGKQGADGLLVRNAGGLEFCERSEIPYIADFSLNAANELTVAWLLAKGAKRVTASFDLSFDQLDDLIGGVDPESLEIVVHQHMPMFHMEFCAFSAHLSNGKPHPECGRPCDNHDVKLRDRVGVDHPLKADVGCRNTLFNAVPQTAAEYLPRLISQGIRHLRVEFLDDDSDSVKRILGLYQEAVAGRRDARNLWRELKATNQYGVTRGQLAILQ